MRTVRIVLIVFQDFCIEAPKEKCQPSVRNCAHCAHSTGRRVRGGDVQPLSAKSFSAASAEA